MMEIKKTDSRLSATVTPTLFLFLGGGGGGGGLRLHKLEHLSPPSTKHEYFTSLEILECFRAVTKEMGPLTHSVTYLE